MEQTEGAGQISVRLSSETTSPTSLTRKRILKNFRQNSDRIGLLCSSDGDSSLVLMEIRRGRSGHRGEGAVKISRRTSSKTTPPTSLARNPISKRKKNSNRLLTYPRGRFRLFPVRHRSGVGPRGGGLSFTIVVMFSNVDNYSTN